jgi:molybdate transport system ATP-binding protein
MRRVGLVPQDYALFPHLTVVQNVSYGLHQLPAAERESRVAESLEWLGIVGLAGRLPRELSGGEAQRVALARAVVRRPRLLLLDEPLSALDASTRQRLRGELANLLAKLNTPAVFVTHDRLEAAVLGAQVYVLAGGQILQHGAVAEVFNSPASLDVARLVGTDTVLSCRVVSRSHGLATLVHGSVQIVARADSLSPDTGNAHVCIRAEDVVLTRDPDPHTSSRNRFVSTVKSLKSEGPLVWIELDCGFPLKALLTRQSCEELGLQPGKSVFALVKASQVHMI